VRRAGRFAAAAALVTVGITGCDAASSSPFALRSSMARTAVRGTGFTAATPAPALTLGQPATVAFEHAGVTTPVRVAIVSITRGAIGDYDAYQVGPADRDSVPFYVRATFTDLGTSTIVRPGLAGLLFAFTPDGGRASPVTAPGFTLCDASEPLPWRPGAVLSECAAYFVPAGTTVTTVTFQANTHQNAVVWRVPPR
jgi:hypothetical protein